jgi:hypothetical protein
MKPLGGIAIVFSALVAVAAAQTKREPTDYSSDAFVYRTFCASCHGASGRGDGPVADLGPPPPDLTLLRQRNGVTFPRAEVRAALDGTRLLPAHQRSGMPNWREVLRETERPGERTIRERIDGLVSHLETLQKIEVNDAMSDAVAVIRRSAS